MIKQGSPLSYLINHQPKRYFMRDDSTNYRNLPLLPDEILEQCLALVHAILETQHNGVKESLTLILEERLRLLQDKLV